MARPGPAAGFNKIRHPQKRAALLAYAETMRVDHAMQVAKISRTHHYYWLKTDPDYKAAFDEVRLMAADVLEAEAVRRALSVEHASDGLLQFLLRGAKPDVYRERIEHSGPGGGALQIADMSAERLEARIAELLAKRNGSVPHPTEA